MTDGAMGLVNVVLAAAGSGTRMKARLPKQYLSLLGATVIEHTLNRLLSMSSVNRIVVAVNDTAMYARYVPANPRVTTIEGGATRPASVGNALSLLAREGELNVPVMVHDAARPCVRITEITTLFSEAANSRDGGLLAIPVSDTLKRADTSNCVESTIDRTAAWRAVTPQLFRLDLLIDALERCHKAGIAVTDESSAMEHCGYSPRLIPCSEDNIKITQATDLKLAQAILEAQERE